MELLLKAIDIATNDLLSVRLETQELKSSFGLRCKVDGKILHATHEFPFFALKEIRRQLERNDIKLLCKGARKDVYPSGMSSIGFKAYKHTLGKLEGELVDIFEEEYDVSEIDTVESQEKFWKKWLQTLKTL